MPHEIRYFTTISQPWPRVLAAARREQRRLGKTALLIVEPPRLPHLAHKAWADELLAASEHQPVAVAALSELALLRLLRLTKGQKRLRVWCLSGRASGGGWQEMRVDNGEFVDRWPEGFFAGRAEELF